MSDRRAGAIAVAAGVAVAVVAHPPYPYPYLFESVSMAISLPLVAAALTVAGGSIVARDASTTTDRPGTALAVNLAPLWSVSLVAAYLTAVPEFPLSSPLILFSLSLGFLAGLLLAITHRLGR